MYNVFGTNQASFAAWECGFSLMDTIKTKPQNCLEPDNTDKPEQVKFHLTAGEVDWMPSLSAARYERTEAILCISGKLGWVFQAHKNLPLCYQTNKNHDSKNWEARLHQF